ncbi:glutamine amidotransferase [Candidatus Entotheonella serta]|nr:glutamine amidotransferase [Candidatus Entotheonella serta]
MLTALAIRHIAFEDLGTLATALNQCNIAIAYVDAGADDLTQIDPLASDILIVWGGPIGAYDEHDYPFLSDELRLLEKRLMADRPTLGICQGAQLIARALGARVYPGPQVELGWSPLELTAAGQASSLSALAGDKTSVFHWHGDTFDLPCDAVHLAATSMYTNQAFSWGQRTLALQCHPEVTARGLERWWIGHVEAIRRQDGVSLAALRQESQRHAASLAPQAMVCWHTWLHDVLTPHIHMA